MDEKQIRARIVVLKGQVADLAGESARYLVMGEYSAAAAEAHRAHQRNLQAAELEGVLNG